METNMFRRIVAVLLIIGLSGTIVDPIDSVHSLNDQIEKNNGSDFPTDDIRIEGEDELAESEWVSEGNGTFVAPCILRDIDMSSYSIVLKNLTSHVRLLNISFSGSEDTAMTLYGLENIEIVNCSSNDRNFLIRSDECGNISIDKAVAVGLEQYQKAMHFASTSNISISRTRLNCSSQYSSQIYADQNSCIREVTNNHFKKIFLVSFGWGSNNQLCENILNKSTLMITTSEKGLEIHNNSFIGKNANLHLKTEYPAYIHNNSFMGGSFLIDSSDPDGSEYGRIEHNLFENCSNGINARGMHPNEYNMDYWNINRNEFLNIRAYAVLIRLGTHNIIHRNLFRNVNPDGLGTGEEIFMQVYDSEGQSNLLYHEGVGNYWSDHTGPDMDMNGFVDDPKTFDKGFSDPYPVTNRKFDTGGPMIELKREIPSCSDTNYILVEYEARDNISEVLRVNLTIDGEYVRNLTGKRRSSVELENGVHDITISALDTEMVRSNLRFKTEVNSPRGILSVKDPVTGLFTNRSTMDLSWMVDDNVINLSQRLHLNGEEIEIGPDVRGRQLNLTEGTNNILLGITDGIGVNKEWERTVVCDSMKPDTHFIGPSDGSTVSNNFVHISWEISDANEPVRKEFKLNHGDWETMDDISDVDVLLEDGDHTAYLRGIDPAGNVGTDTIHFSVGEEQLLKIISPANGTHTSSRDLNLEWEYEGDLSWREAEVRVGRNGPTMDLGTMSSSPLRIGGDDDNVRDGEYLITLRLLLDDDNTIERTSHVILDREAPMINFHETEGHPYMNSSSYSLQWEIVDADDIITSSLMIDGGTPEEIEVLGEKGLDLSEGWHTFRITAEDRSGNGETSQQRIYIDTGSPLISIEGPVEGAFILDTSISISWSIDDDSEISRTALSVDEGSIIDVSGVYSKDRNIMKEGPHRITLIAYDICRNLGIKEVNFISDLEDPSVEIEPPLPSITNSTKIPFRWEISDTNGISDIELYINGETRDIEGSGSLVLAPESGEHTIVLKAEDNAGRTLEREYLLMVDHEGPSMEFEDDRTVIEEERATVYWTATDDLSGMSDKNIMVSVDGGPWVPSSTGISYRTGVLDPGTHGIRIMSWDIAGNSAIISQDIQVGEENRGDSREKGGISVLVITGISLLLAVLFITGTIVIIKKRKGKRSGEEPERSATNSRESLSGSVGTDPFPASDKRMQMKALPAPKGPAAEIRIEVSEYIRPKDEDKQGKNQ